jgi:beta-lactamase class A
MGPYIRLHLLLLSLIVIGMFFSFRQELFAQNSTVISPIGKVIEEAVESIKTSNSENLTDLLVNSIGNDKAVYGIAIKNLITGESFAYNEQESFQSASLYKLWVMGATYDALEKGTLKKEQSLTSDAATLNRQFSIASEAAELTEGKVSNTVEDALEKMITVSDNYTALLLMAKLRTTNVQKFLTANGLYDSKTGSPPKITASDAALFLEKMYKGELVSKEASAEMLALLKRQKLNTRIPQLLPKEVEVAHKTGELDTVRHDAGIIFAKDNTYILVVLSDQKDVKTADNHIARISKNVYDYFEQQKN